MRGILQYKQTHNKKISDNKVSPQFLLFQPIIKIHFTNHNKNSFFMILFLYYYSPLTHFINILEFSIVSLFILYINFSMSLEGSFLSIGPSVQQPFPI